MVKRIFLSLAIVMSASFSLRADELLGNLSNPDKELMSHDFRYVGKYRGYHYGLYNAGYLSTKERPGNLDIDLVLVRWQTDRIDKREFKHIAASGDYPSDGARAPYDPTGFIDGSKLHVLYCPSIDSTCTYVSRTYDLDRQDFDGEPRVCTLDGRVMNVWNVLDIYNKKAAVTCTHVADGGNVQYMGLGMNVAIVRGRGCWYCCLSEVGIDFTCIVACTTDFVNWKTVAIPDLSAKFPGDAFWEAVVHPIKGDIYGFSMRFQTQTSGALYGIWNARTGEFSNIEAIDKSFIARPAFFDYKGETYLCVNIWGSGNTPGYGTVWRATCRFFRIDRKDFSLVPVRTKHVPEGIHYYTFYTENGKLYMIYSTDSRHLDCEEAKNNIAIERIDL